MDDAVGILADVAEKRSPRLFVSLLLALEDSGFLPHDSTLSIKQLFRRGLRAAGDDVADILLLKRLRNGVAELQSAALTFS